MKTLISLVAMLALGACTMCPTNAQLASLGPTTQGAQSTTQTPQCQPVIDNLQLQDSYLKDLVQVSTAPITSKQERARTVQGNLRLALAQLPVACPAMMTGPLPGEINQRIGQIDTYLEIGVWEGPVG
jgi:hypothetical protein